MKPDSTHSQSGTLTSILADFISDRCATRVTGRSVELATVSILDTIAAAVAGSTESAAVMAEEVFLDVERRGDGKMLWMEGGATPDQHALVFGTASHALDYDDVIMSIISHPSAPVLSALLPIVRRESVSGSDLISAFIVGTEVMVRVGMIMGFHHFALGFHSTATLGTLGAAAASARLLKLDTRQSAAAMSIATSMASGVRANFGSMVKPLHVGLAAANGIKAAMLAARGYSAAPEALEGAEGFLSAYSGGQTLHAVPGFTMGGPLAIEEPGFSLKRYPCCYMTHKLISGALSLRRDGVRLEDIQSMQVIMPRGGTKPLIHPRPRNGLNAKFSGPYTIAAALNDGRVDFTSFLDAEVLRPGIQTVLPHIVLEETGAQLSTGSQVGDAPISLVAHLKNGSRKEVDVRIAPGSPEDPMMTEELRAKWMDCFTLRQRHAGGTTAIEKVVVAFDNGLGLHEQNDASRWLDELTECLL